MTHLTSHGARTEGQNQSQFQVQEIFSSAFGMDTIQHYEYLDSNERSRGVI